MKNSLPRVIKIIGYASGVAANNIDCALGPWYMYYHQSLFKDIDIKLDWIKLIDAASASRGIDVMHVVKDVSKRLGDAVLEVTSKNQDFCVMGGDHSSAVGTWSAYAHAKRQEGDIGLIWIDAHMDCHTPETSETQNIHGMPLAHLLGHGDKGLIKLFEDYPALKPENVCLVGIRCYESGEAKLLKSLGIKTFFMDEVAELGIDKSIELAYQHVSQNTCAVGISLDLDGIDPNDAPGVGCPVKNGIQGKELVAALKNHIRNKDISALEIVEYNPVNDVDRKTAKLAVELFDAIYG